MKQQARWILVAVGILIVGVALTFIGRFVGKTTAEKDIERVQLLWPDILTMPEHDRARIARSALACNLSRQPLQVKAVAQCLREGAEKMRNDDALSAERVKQLLAQVGQ